MKNIVVIALLSSFVFGMASCKKTRFTRSSNASATKHKHLWMFHGGGR